ncbi:MAG: molybdate ABC transporter substrate-binding protein [Acidobacteria bacterium]|nr:MAG: molybdate ABC transporter substrate-binding protein [Acidobacteriota bacterium]
MKRLILVPFLLLASFAFAEELHVSVVPAIRDQVKELSSLFEQKNSGWNVVLQDDFAEDIEKQIERDAPIDVFIGNDPQIWQHLNRKKLIDENSLKTIVYDDLVIVTFIENPMQVKEAKDLVYDGMTNVPLVPAETELGEDIREFLTDLGILDSVTPKIQEAKNLKTAMDIVKTGTAAWTFAYESEATKAKRLRIIWDVPETEVSGTEFGVAIISSSKNKDKAKAFVDLLSSQIAARIFENAGYRLATVAQGPGGPVASSVAQAGQTQTAPGGHGHGEKKKNKKKKP